MSYGRALLYALGVTVVSVAALTATRGMPTFRDGFEACAVMFALAFFVLKVSGSKNRQK